MHHHHRRLVILKRFLFSYCFVYILRIKTRINPHYYSRLPFAEAEAVNKRCSEWPTFNVNDMLPNLLRDLDVGNELNEIINCIN